MFFILLEYSIRIDTTTKNSQLCISRSCLSEFLQNDVFMLSDPDEMLPTLCHSNLLITFFTCCKKNFQYFRLSPLPYLLETAKAGFLVTRAV